MLGLELMQRFINRVSRITHPGELNSLELVRQVEDTLWLKCNPKRRVNACIQIHNDKDMSKIFPENFDFQYEQSFEYLDSFCLVSDEHFQESCLQSDEVTPVETAVEETGLTNWNALSFPQLFGDCSEMERQEKCKFRETLELSVLTFNRLGPSSDFSSLKLQDILNPTNACEVAAYLFFVPGLLKSRVGQYLGFPNNFNTEVLQHFLHCFDFSHVELHTALRLLFSKFQSPGESQQLFRIINAFSLAYVNDNSHQNFNVDDVERLSYGILMLHTDHYNAQVRHKMSKEAFLNLFNRSYVTTSFQESVTKPNELLSRESLEKIYTDVVSNEFRIFFNAGDSLYSKLSKLDWQGFVYEGYPRQTTAIIYKSVKDPFLSKMKRGIVFQKFCRNGTTKLRLFKLSDDETQLVWMPNRLHGMELLYTKGKQQRHLDLKDTRDVTIKSLPSISESYMSFPITDTYCFIHSASRTLKLCLPPNTDVSLEAWASVILAKSDCLKRCLTLPKHSHSDCYAEKRTFSPSTQIKNCMKSFWNSRHWSRRSEQNPLGSTSVVPSLPAWKSATYLSSVSRYDSSQFSFYSCPVPIHKYVKHMSLENNCQRINSFWNFLDMANIQLKFGKPTAFFKQSDPSCFLVNCNIVRHFPLYNRCLDAYLTHGMSRNSLSGDVDPTNCIEAIRHLRKMLEDNCNHKGLSDMSEGDDEVLFWWKDVILPEWDCHWYSTSWVFSPATLIPSLPMLENSHYCLIKKCYNSFLNFSTKNKPFSNSKKYDKNSQEKRFNEQIYPASTKWSLKEALHPSKTEIYSTTIQSLRDPVSRVFFQIDMIGSLAKLNLSCFRWVMSGACRVNCAHVETKSTYPNKLVFPHELLQKYIPNVYLYQWMYQFLFCWDSMYLRRSNFLQLENFPEENFDAVSEVGSGYRCLWSDSDSSTFTRCMSKPLFQLWLRGLPAEFRPNLWLLSLKKKFLSHALERYDIPVLSFPLSEHEKKIFIDIINVVYHEVISHIQHTRFCGDSVFSLMSGWQGANYVTSNSPSADKSINCQFCFVFHILSIKKMSSIQHRRQFPQSSEQKYNAQKDILELYSKQRNRSIQRRNTCLKRSRSAPCCLPYRNNHRIDCFQSSGNFESNDVNSAKSTKVSYRFTSRTGELESQSSSRRFSPEEKKFCCTESHRQWLCAIAICSLAFYRSSKTQWHEAGSIIIHLATVITSITSSVSTAYTLLKSILLSSQLPVYDILNLKNVQSSRRMFRRLHIFQALFYERLPLLFNHFKSLQLGPEFYLPYWFSRLFSSAVSLNNIPKLWDRIFLGGEPVLYQIALALLLCHEVHLLSLNFTGCLRLLISKAGDDQTVMEESIDAESYHKDNCTFDNDKFWRYVEQCQVDPLVIHEWTR